MEMAKHLLNVLHHNSFDFRNLSFHLGKLAYLFRVVNTVLHVLFKLGPDMLVKASLLCLLIEDYTD